MAGELTEAELEARRGGLGGSDAGPVFGYGYGTPFSVWCDKLYGYQQDVTPSMQRGHDLEPVVAELFTRKTGDVVRPWRGGQCWSSDEATPWLFATLDYDATQGGLFMDTLLECKVYEWWRARDQWGDDDTGPSGVPPSILLQAHHQMAATDADRVVVAVLFVDTWELRHYVIEADASIRELLIEGERLFWEQHVLARVPPAISDPRRDLAASRSIPVEEREVVLGGDAAQWLSQWARGNEVAREAKALVDEAKAELAGLVGDAGLAKLDGLDAVKRSVNKHGTMSMSLKNPRHWRTTT